MMPKLSKPDRAFANFDEAAQWMLHAVQEVGILHQWDAGAIIKEYGTSDMWRQEPWGSIVIDPKILYRFKKISPSIVYDRWLSGWMRKNDDIHHDPGRGQS